MSLLCLEEFGHVFNMGLLFTITMQKQGTKRAINSLWLVGRIISWWDSFLV